MNKLFEEEFRKLNTEDLRTIINGCAGKNILEYGFNENICKNAGYSRNEITYSIDYIEDDEDGFWCVQWQWENSYYQDMVIGGYFENTIKIKPFNVTFKVDYLSPFNEENKKKNLKEYIYLYINKKCPHYKEAIKEESEKFITFLGHAEEQNSL